MITDRRFKTTKEAVRVDKGKTYPETHPDWATISGITGRHNYTYRPNGLVTDENIQDEGSKEGRVDLF